MCLCEEGQEHSMKESAKTIVIKRVHVPWLLFVAQQKEDITKQKPKWIGFEVDNWETPEGPILNLLY